MPRRRVLHLQHGVRLCRLLSPRDGRRRRRRGAEHWLCGAARGAVRAGPRRWCWSRSASPTTAEPCSCPPRPRREASVRLCFRLTCENRLRQTDRGAWFRRGSRARPGRSRCCRSGARVGYSKFIVRPVEGCGFITPEIYRYVRATRHVPGSGAGDLDVAGAARLRSYPDRGGPVQQQRREADA